MSRRRVSGTALRPNTLVGQQVACYDPTRTSATLPPRAVPQKELPTLTETGSLFDEPEPVFGRFRVTAALGDGRFGPVHLGIDPETENTGEIGRPIKIAEGQPIREILA